MAEEVGGYVQTRKQEDSAFKYQASERPHPHSGPVADLDEPRDSLVHQGRCEENLHGPDRTVRD